MHALCPLVLTNAFVCRYNTSHDTNNKSYMKRKTVRALIACLAVLLVIGIYAYTSTPAVQAASISSSSEAIQHVDNLMVEMTLGDLIRGSDAIVIGRVIEVMPSRGEMAGHTVYTEIIVQPERYLYEVVLQPVHYLYGSGSQNIAVRILGGTIGSTSLWVEDQPEFKLSEQALLFLHRLTSAAPEGIDPQNYYEVYGSVQGKWGYENGMAASISGQKVSTGAIEEIITTPGIVSNQMMISIDGLAPGEQATLQIGPETASLEIENPLFEYPIQGPDANFTVNINTILKDGYYLLLLEAPQKYFRDPKGYAFMVRDSTVVNSTGKTITFKLRTPPSYPAAEAVISLSAPIKAPMPIFPIPLWQRLIEPMAITGAVIIAGLLGVVFWRVARKRRMGQ